MQSKRFCLPVTPLQLHAKPKTSLFSIGYVVLYSRWFWACLFHSGMWFIMDGWETKNHVNERDLIVTFDLLIAWCLHGKTIR